MTSVPAFSYDALPGRVVFGRGAAAAHLAAEVERLDVKRILLVVTPQERDLARRLVAAFPDRVAAEFDEVRPHVPEEVARRGRELAARVDADALLSIGGGSTTGAAKIIALTSGLPVVAVPTTYAGSEMTPIWGMTTDGRKETGRSERVLPRVVVYDPELVETLPHDLTVASGLNAMAHCVEALWTASSSPVVQLLAIEGARSLADGLRTQATRPADAADALLYGAYLAGASFAVAGSGLHHKICHALGGAFDLPHAETHAAVLPHVLAFNSPVLPELMGRLAGALGAPDAVAGLRELYELDGRAHTLASAGLTREQLDEAIEVVSARLPIDNPRPVSADDVGAILTAAFEGAPA